MGIARETARRVVKDYMLGCELPAIYRSMAKRPVDPLKVIFVNSKLSDFPEAFRIIMPYLEDNFEFRISFIGLNQARSGFRSYHERCRAFVREIADASYVFLEDASDVVSCLPLRPETKVINLWHACGAFKKWGLSNADKRFGATRDQIRRHPYYDNLSLVPVSSPEVVWAYRAAMGLDGERAALEKPIVCPLGVSRTDAFFDAGFLAASAKKLAEAFPVIGGRKVILYTPTFRGAVKQAKSPHDLDIEALRQALENDYALVVKQHPFVSGPYAIPQSCRRFAFDAANARLTVSELLAAADVLVTDYSSVTFEFALLGRPQFFFATDLAGFSEERGLFYGYEGTLPGPSCQSATDLAQCIQSLPKTFDPARTELFRDTFMSSCDGHSTERICAEVFGEELLAQQRKSSVRTLLEKRNPHGIDISFIIPAYNAQDTLARALDSLLAQTYGTDRLQIIVADDGSDDATLEVAERYAEEHPGLISISRSDIHTGSPSDSRNRGLALARGEYVFFMDADDWIGPEAAARMLRHAVDWESDLLLVKIAGENNRTVPRSMFVANQRDVNVYSSKVMWTLGSYKLYKRDLIKDLRFPSFMPEDISFVLRAYVLAKHVSVAADYDYYHLSLSPGGRTNISLRTWDDVDSNILAYEDIFGFVGQALQDGLIPADADLTTLMRRLFTRDVSNTIEAIGHEDDHEKARRQLVALRRIAAPYYDPKQLETLPDEKRALLKAAFEE